MNQWWQEERTRDETRPASLLVVDVTPGSGVHDEISANDDRPRQRARQVWRRIAEPLLLLAAVASVFSVTKLADERDPFASAAAPAPCRRPRPTRRQRRPRPRPHRAVWRRLPRRSSWCRPPPAWANRITIVAYRDHRLCGPTVLNFDGTQIPHQVPATTRPATAESTELFLTVQIPSAVGLGRHRIELFGPVPDGQDRVLCGAEPEHQGRLADAEITVIP